MVNRINLVYQEHKGPPVHRYSGPEGEVWLSNQRDGSSANVVLENYGGRQQQDSIWIMEPYCITPSVYESGILSGYKKVFTWASKAFEEFPNKEKIVYINHPSCLGHLSPDQLKERWKPWSTRQNKIAIIANNKTSRHPSGLYDLRLKLADTLHNSGWKIDWYGNACPRRPYSKGSIPDKNSILQNYKFSICTENSYNQKYSSGYFTEKMPEVWLAGAVPIYMGCFDIDTFGFGNKSYIDLRKYVVKNGRGYDINIKQLIDNISTFNEQDYTNMYDQVYNNMKKDNGLFYHLSYDRIYRIMFNTLFA